MAYIDPIKNNPLKSVRINDAICNARDLAKPEGAILLAGDDDASIIRNIDGTVVNKSGRAGNLYFANSFPDTSSGDIISHLLLHKHHAPIANVGFTSLRAVIALAQACISLKKNGKGQFRKCMYAKKRYEKI